MNNMDERIHDISFEITLQLERLRLGHIRVIDDENVLIKEDIDMQLMHDAASHIYVLTCELLKLTA